MLSALQSALAVARLGSVAAAAESQGKTSSAVSQQLRRLEQTVGVRLFERAGRGLRTTAAWETILTPATRLFEEAESVGRLLEGLSGRSDLPIRVAASEYLGRALLAPVIRIVAQAEPGVRFEITTSHSSESLRLLADGHVDAAIVSQDGEETDEASSAWVAAELFRQRFSWVLPRSEDSQDIADRLEQEPLIRLAEGSLGRVLLNRLVERRGLMPRSTIDVPNVSLLVAYAESGAGLGIAPDLALRGADRKRIRTIDTGIDPVPVRLIVRRGFRPTPVVEAFLQRLERRGSNLKKTLSEAQARP